MAARGSAGVQGVVETEGGMKERTLLGRASEVGVQAWGQFLQALQRMWSVGLSQSFSPGNAGGAGGQGTGQVVVPDPAD